MFISFEFICGACVGFELISKSEIDDNEDGWYIFLQLGIIRIIIEK
jgi:hypothetical protein